MIPRLIVMARQPRAGLVKTRIARETGNIRAAGLYRRLLRITLHRLADDPRWRTTIAITPDHAHADRAEWTRGLPLIPQGQGDLGQRMKRIFTRLPRPLVIIGSDAPAITRRDIADAFRALARHDAVIGPASDGGYWLIGLGRRPLPPGLFNDVRWSSPHALSDTLRSLADSRVALLRILKDIDSPDDCRQWARSARCGVISTRLHG